MMAPKLYMLAAGSPSGSVLITSHALGLKLELKELDFLKGDLMSPEYLKLNPQHTVPTLVDDDFVIWDSHAINAYLVRKYGKDDSLYPKDFRKRAVVDNILHFESGSLFPLLAAIDGAYIRKEIKEVPEQKIQEVKKSYDFLEKFLDGQKWIAGDTVTLADIHIVSTLSCLEYHVNVDPKAYPNITAWVKRAVALPCFASYSKSKQAFAALFDKIRGC